MKTWTVILLATFAFAQLSASAALLASEDFNYTAGTQNLDTVGTGGSGWSGNWTNINGDGGDVVSPSLVPVGDSAGILTSGNYAHQRNGSRIGRFLDTSGGGPFGTASYINGAGDIGADGTTVYISFLQQPNITAKYWEFEFHRNNLGDSGRVSDIGNVHLRGPGNPTIVAASTDVSFYVVRIDFQAGNDDVRVYHNPAPLLEAATARLTALSFGDMFFDGVSFGAFVNGDTVNHDEIRFGSGGGKTADSARTTVVLSTWRNLRDPRFSSQLFSRKPIPICRNCVK